MELYFDISASKTRRCVDVKAAAKQLIFFKRLPSRFNLKYE